MKGNVISTMDINAGSCGKGKVNQEIAEFLQERLGAAVTNSGPNAGHSFIDAYGRKCVSVNIPVAIVNPYTELFIGPHSQIDMKVFEAEYHQVEHLLRGRTIWVSPMATIIEERHKEMERATIRSGSTFKGGGAADATRRMRDPNQHFFETYKNAQVCSSESEWTERLWTHTDRANEYILLEGAQGADLSLYNSGNYPYVTHNVVSSAEAMANAGLPIEAYLKTIMIMRPFPIRINNVATTGEFIHTGGNGNGAELTWSDINLALLNNAYPCAKVNPHEYAYNYQVAYHAEPIFNEKINKILEMYKSLPNTYKLQLLNGVNKEELEVEEVDLQLAMEIERLYYKSNGVREYDSIVIKKVSGNGRVFNSSIYHIIDYSEMTSVTKKERRIFIPDFNKLKKNVFINRPGAIYLNFAQYLTEALAGKSGNYEDIYSQYYPFMDNIESIIHRIEQETGVDVFALGTGPQSGECVLRNRWEDVLAIKQ